MRLHKPKDSPFWHAEVVTEDGSVRRLNTLCATRAEAQEATAKLRQIEAAAREHRLTAEVVTLITANRQITVDEALAEWADWSKAGVRSPKTRYNVLVTLAQWSREMTLGARSIGTISTDDIRPWVNPPDAPTKRGTRLLKLSAVRALFRYCLLKRYVLSDPSQLVSVDFRLMTHPQRETRHKPVFTDAEITYLLKRAGEAEPASITAGFFRAAIILGRDLALRLGDICNLEWASFHYARRVVTVWTDKSNTRVEVPLTTRVVRLLANLPAEDDRYIFPSERAIANDPDRRAMLSVAFGRFFQGCGFAGYSFHCLRATYATTLARQGLSLAEIAVKLGHKSTTTTRAYVRTPEASQVAARG